MMRPDIAAGAALAALLLAIVGLPVAIVLEALRARRLRRRLEAAEPDPIESRHPISRLEHVRRDLSGIAELADEEDG